MCHMHAGGCKKEQQEKQAINFTKEESRYCFTSSAMGRRDVNHMVLTLLASKCALKCSSFLLSSSHQLGQCEDGTRGSSLPILTTEGGSCAWRMRNQAHFAI